MRKPLTESAKTTANDKAKKRYVPMPDCRYNCGTHCAMGHYGRCCCCADYEAKKDMSLN